MARTSTALLRLFAFPAQNVDSEVSNQKEMPIKRKTIVIKRTSIKDWGGPKGIECKS
jgi:predicted GNAT family acetyltransferase